MDDTRTKSLIQENVNLLINLEGATWGTRHEHPWLSLSSHTTVWSLYLSPSTTFKTTANIKQHLPCQVCNSFLSNNCSIKPKHCNQVIETRQNGYLLQLVFKVTWWSVVRSCLLLSTKNDWWDHGLRKGSQIIPLPSHTPSGQLSDNSLVLQTVRC